MIARNSSFTYKGRAVDVRQVGRELGVRYVLEGSVRKAAARLRITGQLIDTTSDRHIWADRFDGPIEEVFDLQDQVTAQVIAAIEPALAGAEMERARAKHPSSLTAYDCFLRLLSRSVHQRSPASTNAFRFVGRPSSSILAMLRPMELRHGAACNAWRMVGVVRKITQTVPLLHVKQLR